MRVRFSHPAAVIPAIAVAVSSAIVAWAGGAGPAATVRGSASEPVDFDKHIRPIFEARCWECHGSQKRRGSLRLDSVEAMLQGGKTGPAITRGNSAESLLIQLVSGEDPDRIMPDEGPRLTSEEIGLLSAWIDQGAVWGAATVKAPHKYELALRKVDLPEQGVGPSANPIDRILVAYLAERSIKAETTVDDRSYARRVYLDVIGLLPEPAELSAFVSDTDPNKRPRLVETLLGDRRRYAEHWLTFWNDALRNDYQGTGYIDGGREQITQWLFDALYENLPFNMFAKELVSPSSKASEGFAKGIVWRGVVNASQVPPMQAAQNVSQVFLGLNLKCASCHDSFINDWKLSDAYGMAAAFAEGPLEVNRCDTPQGTMAKASFLYHEVGTVDPAAPRAERQGQLAAALVAKENGRFTRTIVNRLWARLLGRGIIEPVDEMDNEPWSAELLDYLAQDLIDHGYDLKRTVWLILTSRAYQLLPGPGAEKFESASTFAGPVVRRMTAEQFVDAVRSVADVWPEKSDAKITVEGKEGPYPGKIRSALLVADPLMMALGRPNREQVVTSRPGAATTLQAIELTNGAVLDRLLAQGAKKLVGSSGASPDAMVEELYLHALGRPPSAAERAEAIAMAGSPASVDGVQDLLWGLVMLPEFQLVR